MIKGFNKEDFLAQPMELRIEQEMVEIDYDEQGGNVISPLEQTIVLNIGGTDYDLRQLVYSLFDLEAKVNNMTEKIQEMQRVLKELQSQSRSEFVTYQVLDSRICPLECDILNLYDCLESIDSK